jgi:adenine-specific DNA-methyltransferase
MVRRYLHETDAITPQSVFYQPARSASERLGRLLGEAVFDFPKDELVLKQFVEMATAPNENDIVLDFFAGSGSTAHAVMSLNNVDGGNRKFILVQLPEPIEHKKFSTIADITRERVRLSAPTRAVAAIKKMSKIDAPKISVIAGKLNVVKGGGSMRSSLELERK